METTAEPAHSAEKRKLFLARFEAPDFQDIMARVTNRTERKIQSLSWMCVAGGPTPAGKEAMDIVHDAVLKALANENELGPGGSESFDGWLWNRTSSAVSNLVRSYENRMRRRLNAPGLDPVYDDGANTPADAETPASKMDNQELAVIARNISDRFSTYISDDAKLSALLECLGAGITKREEIAQYLEIPVSDVTNLRKRMKRRQEEFAENNQDLIPFKN